MDVFAGFPKQIHVGSRPGTGTYTQTPGYYAIHGEQAGPAARNAAHVFNEGTIAVFKGSPESATVAAAPGKLSPVYSLAPGGSPAVPTGLIFVRLTEGIPVSKRDDEIKGAGYEIAEGLAYAPNAAWLRARSGKIEDALKGLEALKKIPDVESVEPQMLMESARR
jgi:hypothetical protein